MNNNPVYELYLKNIISNLPDSPGCYQYFDEKGIIIYVGKAKSLKKRVSSYFVSSLNNQKTRVLVSKIRDLKYIVVETEEDSFLLENNLIKKYQPRYNILLKDDKSYPFIVIKNENFPRVFLTRNKIKDGSQYFGPYASGYNVKMILEIIHTLFPLRTCNLNLERESINADKYKVCLQYHIKKCLGPCVGKQSEMSYLSDIELIKDLLKGNTRKISLILENEMRQLAENLKFEQANEIKRKFQILENFRKKSTVVSEFDYNLDVFNVNDDDNSFYCNFLKVFNGSIIQSYNLELKKKLNESAEELLGLAIIEIRNKLESESSEIIVPFLPDIELLNVTFTIPQRGDKLKLLHLSEQNAKQYKIDKLKRSESLNPEQRSMRIVKTIQSDLKLKKLPIQIECFDNSNIQGTNPVSACVVFKMGKPSKKDYRHYKVKTVEGPDDFATMREILFRRYSRLLAEEADLPQLILIDGGKGQLSSAVSVLKELGLYGEVAVVGIAKRLEEIYFPEDSIPLYLDKNSESLKVFQHLRDEAHRFCITFHRNVRSKAQVMSELDGIKGIGKETKKILIKKFGSIKRLKGASEVEIEKLIGKSRAHKLIEYFSREN
jgi:excinuclease ABC subunit C